MSFWTANYRGDIHTNEGSLGQAIYDTLSANVTLTPTTDYSKLYSRYYFINNTGGTLNITMPAINNTATIQQHIAEVGWYCLIKNNGDDPLDLKTPTTALTIYTILKDKAVLISAKENNGQTVSDWEIVTYNTNISSLANVIGPASATLVEGSAVGVDDSSGAVTLTFPSSATDGAEILVKSITTDGVTNGITINTGGTPIENPSDATESFPPGTTATFLPSVAKEGYIWAYFAEQNQWRIISNATPVIGNSGNFGSQTISIPVKTGRVVSADRGVSLSSETSGTVVQGISKIGTALIPDWTELSNTFDIGTILLDSSNSRIVIMGIDGTNGARSFRVIDINGADDFPTYGTTFNYTSTGSNDNKIYRLDNTHFLHHSSSGSTQYLRVYTVSGTTVTGSGTEVSTTNITGAASGANIVILNNGAEFVLHEIPIGGAPDAINMEHFSVAGTTITQTGYFTGVYTSTFTSSAGRERGVALNTTDMAFKLYENGSNSAEVVIIRWTGAGFTAGSSVAVSFTGSNNVTDPVFISSTLFALGNNIGRYATFSVSGLVITAETTNTQLPGTNPSGEVLMSAIDSTNIIATYIENTMDKVVHGTVAGGSPFAITWGTRAAIEDFSRDSLIYLTSTIGLSGYNGDDMLTMYDIDQGSNAIRPYDYGTDELLGIAATGATGPSNVNVTICGGHVFDGESFTIGVPVNIKGDGSPTQGVVVDNTVFQSSSGTFGIAYTSELSFRC